MSLSQSLSQITASGFEKMPHSIAKVLSDGIEELKKDDLSGTALQVGDTIPDIELINPENRSSISLKDLIKHEYLVLNFYRGGWCPYCNLELRAYEQLREQFKAVSANIVSISAELPDRTISTATRNKLSHTVLTDHHAKLANAIGIDFQLNKDLQREYANFGINLSELHGNEDNVLLVPAVFIIDKDMKIVWSHIEENYMIRAEPLDVMNELKRINERALVH